MSSFIINGGKPLAGEISVYGNKNAVLPAMAAALLTDKTVELDNVPQIRDVNTMGLLLSDLGASLEGLGSRKIKIQSEGLRPKEPDNKLVADLRASILLLGPLLARFGKTVIRHPGGDIIGRRSIDEHLKSLEKLGVKIEVDGIMNKLSVKKLHGAGIHLTEASVTATENIMMAAVLADGETQITNAAAEPHVQCLGKLLNCMGARIEGTGSNKINVQGVNSLNGCSHKIRTDHIEVGTWAIIAAVTGGEIKVKNAIADDLLPMKAVFEPMGVIIKETPSGAKFTRGILKAFPAIKTNIWPGFPTDLMSPTIVLATQCRGMTLAHDWMYEGRMFFVDKLIKMGANIIVADPHRIIINGPTQFFPRHSSSPDIRAGAALVIASLAARGESVIDMAEIVDRGYENLEQRLTGLGANIKRIS
ncbi:UDP-N-acetylglucosamine 1-carboxyvinyltransferase [Candidatus Collierbacteria bacterium]|nr:UDP-N-acetylglucosamine 1-carboxyvinyltransferase [Candidatus Collierbacteria bacterium]